MPVLEFHPADHQWPEFAITWRREGDRLHGVITQTTPYYRVSLPVLVSSADSGSTAMIVVVNGPRTEFSLTPRFDPATWTFRCFGLVEEEVSWTWEEFLALPRSEVFCDIHCVTRWSRLDNRFEGVQ